MIIYKKNLFKICEESEKRLLKFCSRSDEDLITIINIYELIWFYLIAHDAIWFNAKLQYHWTRFERDLSEISFKFITDVFQMNRILQLYFTYMINNLMRSNLNHIAQIKLSDTYNSRIIIWERRQFFSTIIYYYCILQMS